MDRLRSLQYFIAAADTGSFSGAARRLDVSIPAVAKLVNALERSIGVSLFERSPQGLALTAAGESYLEACRPAVASLDELDEQVRSSATRARGTVVVGIQHVAAREILCPALPRFRARHPEIHIDLRDSTQMVDPGAPGIDVYISFAWPKAPDMIHRALGISRFVVCAAPSYWDTHGVPQHPRELARHDCILIRTQTGTLMDVWKFTRGGETEEVTVKGWLACSNMHRDVGINLAVAGMGVVRVLDWANRGKFIAGALVSVLNDWEGSDPPPLYVSYRPSARRLARVRLFITFVQELLQEMEVSAAGNAKLGPAPNWAGSTAARASSLGRRVRR